MSQISVPECVADTMVSMNVVLFRDSVLALPKETIQYERLFCIALLHPVIDM
jgi:hypothetical protein